MVAVSDIIVRKPTQDDIQTCSKWPVWTCRPSIFNWEYDEKETCLILEGSVNIKSLDGSTEISFAAGDMVIFPKDLKCSWQVIEAVRKHYNFG
jgi:uncharacterized cupin superfamily protein